MSEKPAFDPSQPFDVATQEKPAFDPSAPFEATSTTIENEPTRQDETGKIMSAFSGLGQGSSLGFGDELAGVYGAGLDAIVDPNTRSLAGLLKSYREARDFARNLNTKAKSDNPWTYGLSEVAGGVAGSAPFGAGAATVKGAGALGGAYGLGGSDADLTKGEIGNAALDTAIGAGIGAGTAGLMNMLPTIGRKFESNADETALKALGGNAAAFKQNIKSGNNLGAKALDEGIIGPFSSTEKMLERAQLLKQAGGETMDEAFKKADAIGNAFDPWETGSQLWNREGGFYKSPLNRDLNAQINNTIDAIRMRGKEPISLQEAQILKDELSRVAYPKGQSPLSPSDKQLLAQDAVRLVRDNMNNAAESLLGQDGKQLLQRGRSMYGTGKGSEDLLTGKLAREQSKGGFSFSDALYKPVNAMVSPQMRSWTGKQIGRILQTSPQSFGKFAPVLQQAAQRGPAAVNAAVHVLQQNDAEFRSIQRQLNGQEQPNE